MIHKTVFWALTLNAHMKEKWMSAERLNYEEIAPAAFKALLGVEAYVQQSGLGIDLIELVKLRASQINGCAYCMDMHTKTAREHGESEQRLYLLNGWREVNIYTARERAALAWTEALTLLPGGHAPDSIYTPQINSWNRMAVGLRKAIPGDVE